MKIIRRKTKIIKIGGVAIGGNYPVAIQSMVKTKTSDVRATLKQIEELDRAGCEIVRLAVKDESDARTIKALRRKTRLPLVADIHFSWRLAMAAIDSGADKIRLNPGNIFKKNEIREIAAAAKQNRIPIRVGVNSGSVKGHQATASQRHESFADTLVESALGYIKILEGFKFYDIAVSLKANNVLDTLEAYRKFSKICDYPLHLGVTATGLPFQGAIKSGIAIGALLLEGIGDTIRISLTDKPAEEVKAARAVLEALELRSFGPQIVSCPTCGRCEVDLVRAVKELENKIALDGKRYTVNGARPLKVALMGCVVNGPGEAREADAGIAFGKKEGLLFKKGKAAKKVSFSKCVDNLLSELEE